ncbi:hypothetical protein KLH71_20380, partial [Bacillus subtilis]|uniref:hypothetical protein n=2 Tax=Bacillaceae TaxID=186817 RepID=UPI001BE3D62B
PMSYYNLRSDQLPNLIGDKAAKYFFWAVFGGFYSNQFDFEFEETEVVLMNYIILNYSAKFIRAKQYNINPLGFDSIHFTYGPENDRVNTYIKRNDEEQFTLRLNPWEFTFMLKDSIEYFSNMINDDVLDYKPFKDSILENVELIQDSLTQLKNKIKKEELS